MTTQRMSRREFVKTVGAGLGMVGLAGGCTVSSPTAAPAPATAAPAVAPTKAAVAAKDLAGKVTFCYDGWGGAAWDEIFAKVKSELPGVELEVILINGDEMADKSITMCAAGQMTWDIVVWGGRRQDHIDGGYILPVGDYVKKELVDDLTDVYKEVMSQGGKLWTLPWYQNYGFTIEYNKGMWDKAGLEAGPALTWSEFSKQLYQLRDKGVIKYPFTLSGKQDFDSALMFDNIVKAHGGYWFEPWTDAKEIKPAFTSNPHNIEAAEWITKLIKDEIVHPASMNFEGAGIDEVYLGGETATMLQYYYSAAKALDPSQSKIVDQAKCALIPGVDGKVSGGSFASGEGYYLYTAAKDRNFDAAVAVYEVLTGPWANTVWAELAALGPAYKSIQQDARVLKGLPFMDVWAKQGEQSIVRETNSQWEKPFAGLGVITEWKKNQETYLSALYTGSMDAKTMWQKLEEDYVKLEARAIKEGRQHSN